MDIVRIILNGYGCDISRGILTREEYTKLERSNSLDDIWVKGLYKYLGTKWERIDLQEDYGILNGDITIFVNDEVVLDVPISVLNSVSSVDACEYQYPRTSDIVMTTIQHHSGKISDMLFITSNTFDVTKLTFVCKDIHNENNEVIIESLISEVYYDGEPIPFGGSVTDLRMSNIYFDNK
jgi:hypothetical protein